MVYEDWKVWGPYVNYAGRYHVVISPDSNQKNRINKSYPRYLMEVHLDRILDKNEDVHHIDGNKANNDMSNLKVVDMSEHRRSHTFGIKRANVITEQFICIGCGIEFSLSREKRHSWRENKKKGGNGPYCSKECYLKNNKKTPRKDPITFVCPTCQKQFTLIGRKLTGYKQNLRKIKEYTGPYCSRKCIRTKH